jgi:hypothetical protein
MTQLPPVSDSAKHNLFTLLAYVCVALMIGVGWYYADLALYRPQEGLGYWFGIIGTTLMGLLLFYPVRKRVKALRNAGPVRYWFRTHMIFGVVGPLFIIFHSNFNLGSLNSRIALFCTLIVAASGIIGRYFYAKLHYGLYGKRASLVTLRKDISEMRGSGSGIGKLIPSINEELNHWEDTILSDHSGVLRSFWTALTIAVTSRIKYQRLKRLARRVIDVASQDSSLLEEHRDRIRGNVKSYLKVRISLLRKFAQHKAFESLFSLWHIVHYPLFLLLVLAAIVHIVAVHMY